MSDKQLAFLIDNMAKALAARLQALESAHPLTTWVPAGPLDRLSASVLGEKAPETVPLKAPELVELWELVSSWQDDAADLRRVKDE